MAVMIVISAVVFNNNANAVKAILPSLADDAQTLKNSTLIVVLLQESTKYEEKLTKLKRPLLVKAYQDAIKTYNDNIQAVAEKYLSLSASIEYKTMT